MWWRSAVAFGPHRARTPQSRFSGGLRKVPCTRRVLRQVQPIPYGQILEHIRNAYRCRTLLWPGPRGLVACGTQGEGRWRRRRKALNIRHDKSSHRTERAVCGASDARHVLVVHLWQLKSPTALRRFAQRFGVRTPEGGTEGGKAGCLVWLQTLKGGRILRRQP